jgi:hypothetical protein
MLLEALQCGKGQPIIIARAKRTSDSGIAKIEVDRAKELNKTHPIIFKGIAHFEAINVLCIFFKIISPTQAEDAVQNFRVVLSKFLQNGIEWASSNKMVFGARKLEGVLYRSSKQVLVDIFHLTFCSFSIAINS